MKFPSLILSLLATGLFAAPAENSFATPAKIVPRTTTLSLAGTTFAQILPANSIAILRIKTAP